MLHKLTKKAPKTKKVAKKVAKKVTKKTTAKKSITKTAKRSISTTKKAAKHSTKSSSSSFSQSSFDFSPEAPTAAFAAPVFSFNAEPTTTSVAQPSFLSNPIKTQFASFHQTKRIFNEPAATGPAAIDDIAPEVKSIVDGIMKLNIMQTLQLVKILKAEFGYSDAAFAAPVAAAPGAGAAAAAAPAEEAPKAAAKTVFNVKLDSFDAGSKVKLIKAIREQVAGLGLKEAKELVEGAPCIIKKDLKTEDAENLIKALKEAGAVCVME